MATVTRPDPSAAMTEPELRLRPSAAHAPSSLKREVRR